jgi:acetyltransferase
MAPNSVAVIGASRKTGPGSFNVIESMREFGFQGRIYPVNPMAKEIAGVTCYKQVKEIPDVPELAIISTPREFVPQTLEDCAALGIKGAVIVPQGFADADAEGLRLQKALSRISRENGIRVLGPNTLGVVNSFSGFSSSFMPLKREKVPVGVICQSGTFFVGSAVLTGMLGKGIDVGNGCDLDFSDALEYFGEDDDIELIFLHIEGLRGGRRFFEIARKITRKKPIIALKTARTERGAQAASTHSGSFVGKYEVFEAAFRQAGIITAEDPDEVLDTVRALLYLSPMRGKRVGLVTFTGAGGIILIDTLEEEGLQVSELSSLTIKTIKDLSPAWMPIQNPLDIWPALMKHGMDYVYRLALDCLLRDSEVDGVICIAICPHLPDQSFLDVTGVIREKAAAFKEKPVVAWLYGPNQSQISERLEQGGHVVSLPTLPRAARAIAVLYRRGQYLKRPQAQPVRFKFQTKARIILQKGIDKGEKTLSVETARRILEISGIPSVRSRFCGNLAEALNAADGFGYPVALKIASPQIIHKSDVGAVALNVQEPEHLQDICQKITEEVRKRFPAAEIRGFIVEEMAPAGFDAFLGAKRDPQFGPVVLFGTGGIYTEVWQDIAHAVAPLSRDDAIRMIKETRCFEILKGVRGEKGYDIDAVIEALLRLSWLMAEMDSVSEMDINPFRLFPVGALALDVRMILI